MSAGNTTLSIQPSEATAAPCVMDITVRLDNVENLTAFSVYLTYPPDALQVLSVANGDFLVGEMPEATNGIDPESGIVRFGMARIGEINNPPESGSGDLVRLSVMAISPNTDASITLDIVNTHLVGWPSALSIPYTVSNGVIHTSNCQARRVFLPLILR